MSHEMDLTNGQYDDAYDEHRSKVEAQKKAWSKAAEEASQEKALMTYAIGSMGLDCTYL